MTTTNITNVPSDDKIRFLSDCARWVKGTIFQGERLLCVLIQRDIDIYKCEEDFFVFALDRAVFMLKQLTKSDSDFKIFIDEIDNAVGLDNIKDVRDMITHIDEYAKGKGRNQKRFVHEVNEKPTAFQNTKIMTDATSTISFVGEKQENSLIGGRLNIQKSIAVMKKIYPSIESLCMNKRFQI